MHWNRPESTGYTRRAYLSYESQTGLCFKGINKLDVCMCSVKVEDVSFGVK